jgi:biopolymer transport protein ExbD
MRFTTKARKTPTINIVSLIDILCILLIFFVVTTEFKKDQPQLEIQLPESTQGTNQEKPDEPIMILATKDKKIFLNNKETPLQELSTKLKGLKAAQAKALFVLKADTGIDLGFFVKVMDAATEAGIPNLSLLTDEPAP